MAESADALRSGRSGETRGSSNLPFGTVARRLFGIARTLTSEWQGRKDGRGQWVTSARGKSELRRAKAPGESQGGGCEPVDSPDWRTGQPAREQQKPNRAWRHEPAEKGNPPCSNLRSDRYQVARRGRKSRAAVTREGRPVARPREMIIVNRTRLTFRPVRLPDIVHGAFSSVGRALVCGTRGHGFKPRKAPLEKWRNDADYHEFEVSRVSRHVSNVYQMCTKCRESAVIHAYGECVDFAGCVAPGPPQSHGRGVA